MYKDKNMAEGHILRYISHNKLYTVRVQVLSQSEPKNSYNQSRNFNNGQIVCIRYTNIFNLTGSTLLNTHGTYIYKRCPN